MPVINTRATRRILASYRSRMPRSLVTPAIVCAIALSWAGTWVVGKLAVATVPPLELSAARYVLASLALVAVTLALITLRDRSPFEVVALATPIGALILLPLGLLERSYVDVPTWSAGIWLDVAYLGVVVTAVSFPLFYWVVRRVGAGPAALTTYLVPVLTLVLAAVVLGERPAPLQLVGAAVILAGVQLATSGARVATRRTAPEAAT